ncbi:hypothetical protein CDAR_424211 [Caerostris darwini]|uniref:Secreted protein n=1 Tax=Caerostris darwini TaxID=1538125 RepID=A0AAV4T4H7_9ARAC|nr:hypothetical protein CDAR_424211 [Caerostris darwini]
MFCKVAPVLFACVMVQVPNYSHGTCSIRYQPPSCPFDHPLESSAADNDKEGWRGQGREWHTCNGLPMLVDSRTWKKGVVAVQENEWSNLERSGGEW